nr:PREDICTED: nose resistant to fluoxetine protein 6-like [Bemisia tabaci]
MRVRQALAFAVSALLACALPGPVGALQSLPLESLQVNLSRVLVDCSRNPINKSLFYEHNRVGRWLQCHNVSEVTFPKTPDRHPENATWDALGSRLFSSVAPPFAPLSSSNQQCKLHSQQFLKRLAQFDLWALQMYDASAKLPSGMLSGNVNQYGDFDECLKVESPDGAVAGQYCLSYLEIKLAHKDDPKLNKLHSLLHSHSFFKSDIDDPGHRVPRSSSINWGVCAPASCSAQDIQDEIWRILDTYLSDTGVKYRVKVDPEMCTTRQRINHLPTSFFVVGGLFLAYIGMCMLAALFEHMTPPSFQKSTAAEYFISFSLKKNFNKLFSTSVSADDISSVHGIRALNALMLILCHKSMAMFYNPYVNRTAMSELIGKPWTAIIRAASLYTDPFIMLSGLLTSYVFFKQFEKNKSISVPKEISSRLLRLVPTLGALILFCTFVFPFVASGPQWNQVVSHHATICKDTWWRNLLFIHNYFGFKNMCLTHTHHIGIDTQLFLTSPLFVWLVWKWPKPGMITLFVLGVFSTILRFYASYIHQLSLFVYYGNPVHRLFDTADLSYIIPSHRLTVYLIGIGLAYCLRKCGRDFKLKQSHLSLGWLIALCMLYYSLASPSKMGDQSYVYDRWDAANYAAFAPITWCLYFAWIIFISHTGNGGIMGRALSWKGFVICTKLSYSVYLTQFPVFFYNVGTTRHADTYQVFLLINFKELISIAVASIALTILFEIPFQNIRSIIFRVQPKPAVKSQ